MKHKLIGLSLLPLLLSFASCSSSGDGKIKILCSIYPEYEWAQKITEGINNVSLSLLVDENIDFHSYQPSIKDISEISNADYLIYVGGESEKWIDNVVIDNPNQVKINLFDILGEDKKEEEDKEGMEGEEHEEKEYDEHVWNSLVNAQIFVREIAARICQRIPEESEKIMQNASKYIVLLDNLHKEYVDEFNNSTHKTQVVADRFPFRYLFDDYGLDYYAAFKGCSAESEASFATIVFLSNKVDELGLSHIIKTSNSDGRVAQAVKNNTKNKDQEIVNLDSLETKSKDGNKTYLSIMKDNLDILLECTK